MAIDKRLLEMCKTAIRQRLGNLDDLPGELANTVANKFYKHFQLAVSWTESKLEKQDKAFLPKIKNKLDKKTYSLDSTRKILSYYERIKTDQAAINKMTNALRNIDKLIKMISDLRMIDKANEPIIYQDKVNYTLDVMKYNIKDSKNLDSIMRAIERNLKRRDVDEFPDLYKYF